MLNVKNVDKSFGGIKALNKVSMKVEKGAIVGLIGPNGSGKSTLFNVVSGFIPKDDGEIYLKGNRIDGLSPFEIAQFGITRSFQIAKAPKKMTVLENMLLACKIQVGEDLMGTLFNWRKVLNQEKANLEKAKKILEITDLIKLKNEYAGNLSGGQQKLLSLSRILAAEPELVLLDEPAAGVNLTLIGKLMTLINKLRSDNHMTFLIVEHNMKFISEICDKVYVLDSGIKIAEGTPQEVQNDPKVLEAYLTAKRDNNKNQV